VLERDIGAVIRRARERLRASQAELALRSSVDAALLAQQEDGALLLSTAKLDRIASALALDPAALCLGREQARGLVAHPKYAGRTDFRQEDLRTLDRAHQRAEALRELSALLGERTLLDQVTPRAPGAKAAHDGYAKARQVRRLLGLPIEPLPELAALAVEKLGVTVSRAPLSTRGLHAATVRSSASRAAAIVLNEAPADRVTMPGQVALLERVDICHELCHALFDEPVDQLVDLTVERAGTELDESRVEKRARAFAAELLLPLEGLTALLGKPVQTKSPKEAAALVGLARAHYLTPLEIAVHHLGNRGYYPQFLRQGLLTEGGHRPSAPATDESAWRRALESRARRAHQAGLISGGAARVMLELELGEPLPWELGH
jgi:transcriptional regulator with XRE-family HTH domain